MSTFLVTSGFDQNGLPSTQTVKADSFATDEQFVVFKTGSVVVKAIRAWMVDAVENLDAPEPKNDNDTT